MCAIILLQWVTSLMSPGGLLLFWYLPNDMYLHLGLQAYQAFVLANEI